MSQQSQSNRPLSLNMDKAYKYLTDTEAFYLLNHERFLNLHGSKKNGATIGETTPLVANYAACEIEQPQGENYCIGTYRSPITNEVYSWHYNSNGAHYILRISNVGCEVVYHGDCLELSSDPRHSIEQWRAYLKVDPTCKNQHGKQLIFTDGKHDIYQIDVEAAIETSNFTTSYFARCSDPCDMVKMCVPYPAEPITATPLPVDPKEVNYTNRLLDKAFKFMYQWEYYDGRKSEWSARSTLYFVNNGGCFDSAEGLSRCFGLRVPFGNPMVTKIHIAFSTDNGTTWARYDTVEKYKKYNDNQQKWYERQLSEEVTSSGFSNEECVFQYAFCNDKQTASIDPTETKRVYNPMPREAQGLVPIKNALGFYNYKLGTCPIDDKEMQKLTVEEVCKEKVDCNTQYVEVIVRAVVHNFTQDLNQPLYTLEPEEKDVDHVVYFGGLNQDKAISTTSARPETGFGQEFKKGTDNFIVYIEGTNYWAEMEQWRVWMPWTNKSKVGLVRNMGDKGVAKDISKHLRNGDFFMQEARIKVPRGTKGFFRLASHTATSNAQETSTFVYAILNDLRHYKGDRRSDVTWDQEIYFDTTNVTTGTLELMNAFVVQDNAVDSGGSDPAAAFCGYLVDSMGRPIEGAIVAPIDGTRILDQRSSMTDHNGFWHLYMVKNDGLLQVANPWYALLSKGYGEVSFAVLMEQENGEFKSVKTFAINGTKGTMTRSDQEVENPEFKDKYLCTVRVLVRDCDNKPVGGIRVALSGSKYDVSDPRTGIAEFKVRNYRGPARRVRYIVLDPNACFTLNCANQCNPSLPSEDMLLPESFAGEPPIREFVNPAFINKYTAFSELRGLKAGGRYGWGAVMRGLCGKLSAVNQIGYVNVKKTQERGAIDFCNWELKLKDKNDPAHFPAWVDYLEVVRTENLNGYELQWVVDKIEYLSQGRMKLTIQSLNDYNATYLFKTNTIYQYLQGDRVEFIRNGDGKVIPPTNGILNYAILSPYHDKDVSGQDDADVNFFNQILVDNDGRLDGIKEGAVIELQRPKDLSDSPIYYSIGVSIALDKEVLPNGEVVSVLSSPVEFNSFDTYLVKRNIDKITAQEFEHHSPTDFWQYKMDDRGLGYVLNEYEDERRWGRKMAINAPLQFNFFSADMVKTFDAPEQGDIIAMGIWDGKAILAIGERDNFMAQVADDLLRVGGDGVIRAAGGSQIVSDAQPKISGQFGCQYPHIGSIFFGDGYATWTDVGKLAYILHDLSQAQDVSTGRTGTYFRKRLSEIEAYNSVQVDNLNRLRLSTGINNSTGALHLTIKALRDNGIYNHHKPFQQRNDTILYHPKENDWLGFASYTAEAYTFIDLNDEDQCAFISYLHGVPYIHPVISDKFNEFYGAAVDRVVGITINKFADKIKRPVSLEVQDQTMWYVKEVATDKDSFASEIPPVRMKKTEDKWNGAFLADKNSRDGLYGDAGARGYWINVTLVRDNTQALKYNTIDNTKRTKFDKLDMILFKFTLSEGSGFTENL